MDEQSCLQLKNIESDSDTAFVVNSIIEYVWNSIGTHLKRDINILKNFINLEGTFGDSPKDQQKVLDISRGEDPECANSDGQKPPNSGKITNPSDEPQTSKTDETNGITKFYKNFHYYLSHLLKAIEDKTIIHVQVRQEDFLNIDYGNLLKDIDITNEETKKFPRTVINVIDIILPALQFTHETKYDIDEILNLKDAIEIVRYMNAYKEEITNGVFDKAFTSIKNAISEKIAMPDLQNVKYCLSTNEEMYYKRFTFSETGFTVEQIKEIMTLYHDVFRCLEKQFTTLFDIKFIETHGCFTSYVNKL